MTADGWGSRHIAEADGGQGLPIAIAFAADEFVSSGAMSFALDPALRLEAYKVLQTLGDVDPVFRQKLGSGEWTKQSRADDRNRSRWRRMLGTAMDIASELLSITIRGTCRTIAP